ncbi:MarR family transcriptional regulator [Roseiarcus fermentans]|uniref:MarR family transcriptional regulator n=1 Tax=Roseiarcus fermentans TaxID=1473586 RepID=A0A366FGS4_9HYPH|nr:MarR family transcriptional regulator [Roseiarcus fermentans]RBP13882.1 MarR family transcriptional regulator [Roseiarcus fermentans]
MRAHTSTVEPLDDAAALAGQIRAVVGKLTRRLRGKAPPGGLSWSQARVLGRLEREGPTTLTALAREENMRSQSMGAIVGPLAEAGLIVGAPDPSDGRQTLLSVTAKGRDKVLANRRIREDWLAERMRATLTAEERAALTRALALMDIIADD